MCCVKTKTFQVEKIKHHRAAVTALQVSTASDVLVSSSLDTTICLWSLENFSLLNTIQLNGPIFNIQISSDSVSSLSVCVYFVTFFFVPTDMICLNIKI